jgi:hypothetical protein
MTLLDLARKFDHTTDLDQRCRIAEEMRPLLGERYPEFDEKFEEVAKTTTADSCHALTTLLRMRLAEEDAVKRHRALARIATYLESLPCCLDDARYSAADKAGLLSAQERILNLCADPTDKAALSEFLLDFSTYVLRYRQRIEGQRRESWQQEAPRP